ncbi:hypothetical protein B484DRAFT_401171, partial [Ochromonadaceae sp. CCMP2298]
LLVALQESFQHLTATAGPKRKKAKVFKKGQSIKELNLILSQGISAAATLPSRGKITASLQDPDYEYDASVEGELGKELTAATMHNLSLKRPTVTPGVLLVLLALAKNCKTLRVLHCIRTLANMSTHPKSKVLLGKEARKILPMLTVSMRCGCAEAEKVQHYCAITLCNMLASPLEKGLLAEWVSSGAIVDLMVVTLLRINSIYTKDTLGKAFFNLLCRPEIREALILKLDMLSALLELSKIEYLGLLELCMHAMFNITCELRPGSGFEERFASKLSSLNVPRFVVARLVYTPTMDGSVGTRTRLADALKRVYKLGGESASFCAAVSLFQLSRIPECRVLADSKVIQ